MYSLIIEDADREAVGPRLFIFLVPNAQLHFRIFSCSFVYVYFNCADVAEIPDSNSGQPSRIVSFKEKRAAGL